jgi:hypothetical protein
MGKLVIKGLGVVGKGLLKLVKKPLKKLISNPALKRFIANKINEKVDIPKLNEAQEQALFEAHIEALSEFLDAVL